MTAALRIFTFFSLSLASTMSMADESWVFRRSYYSHDPVAPVQVGPPVGFKQGPYFTRSEGAYTRGAVRRSRGFIRVGGQVFDQLNYWEAWVKTGRQY